MKQLDFKATGLIAILSVTVLAVSVLTVSAQDYVKSNSTSKSTKSAKQAGMAAGLTAKLVDPEKKAKGKAATVEVTVTGVSLIDPAKVREIPKAGQAHFHYQVDNGPVIATTTTKLSFHELSSGQHTITVMLAGNDHKPLGPQQTLTVTVP
jgi:hypothetical protein